MQRTAELGWYSSNKFMKNKIKTDKEFMALVDEKYIDKINYLASRLRRKGFTVKEKHKSIGVITGSAPLDVDLDEFKMKGIETMEQQRAVRKSKK